MLRICSNRSHRCQRFPKVASVFSYIVCPGFIAFESAVTNPMCGCLNRSICGACHPITRASRPISALDLFILLTEGRRDETYIQQIGRCSRVRGLARPRFACRAADTRDSGRCLVPSCARRGRYHHRRPETAERGRPDERRGDVRRPGSREKLLEAASAIQVITQEDIRRSGATSIPEALRLADNLQVAQKNSHDWAISARGFNTDLANKLLVLIDGRTVYTPLYSGVFWDVQDYLLEDIDRIEVISGPGGTLWGANAVNGVINIITKSADDTQGLYVEGGGGTQLAGLRRRALRRRAGADTSVPRLRQVFRRAATRSSPTATRRPDAWHQRPRRIPHGFGRATTTDRLTLQGDIYDGTRARADRRRGRRQRRRTSWAAGRARVSADSGFQPADVFRSHASRRSLRAADPHGVCSSPRRHSLRRSDTYDLDFQHRFAIGHDESDRLGPGLSLHARCGRSIAAASAFLPPTLDQNLYSGFVQDEIALRPTSRSRSARSSSTTITPASRSSRARGCSGALSPTQAALGGGVARGAHAVAHRPRSSRRRTAALSGICCRAARISNPKPWSPTNWATARSSSPQALGLASSFYNHYNDVRSTSITPATILPLYFPNNLEGETYGAGAERDLSGLGWLVAARRLQPAAGALRVKPGEIDLNDALNETADPEQQFSLRSSLTCRGSVEFDAALRWVDTLHNNNGAVAGTVPAISSSTPASPGTPRSV